MSELKCMRCERSDGVEIESGRTAYHWDGKGEDPNRSIPLCRECAKEHHDYWDERWSEYYGGLL